VFANPSKQAQAKAMKLMNAMFESQKQEERSMKVFMSG